MITGTENEAERTVLAALVVNPEFATDVARVAPARMWNDYFAASIFRAVLELGGADTHRIIRWLGDAGELGKLGGAQLVVDTLREWVQAYPTGGDPEFWTGRCVNVIRTDYCRRRVKESCSEVSKLADSKTISLPELSSALDGISEELSDSVSDASAIDAARIIGKVSALRSKGGEPRIPTGYSGLDTNGGMVTTGLYVVAARTGEGKSSLTANLAVRMQKAGRKFGLVTIEMSAPQMVTSMLGVFTGIDRARIEVNKLTPNEANEITDAESALGSGWHIADSEGLTVEEIGSQARIWQRKHGIEVLFIDHLQRIKATDGSLPRHLQVGHITWSLKGLARTLGIPVVLAVQINREGAREGIPKLHHLKESGSVEEDADGVLAIYVDRAKNDRNALDWDCQLMWLKNRHGALTSVDAKFNKPSGRIVEVDHGAAVRQQFQRQRRDLE